MANIKQIYHSRISKSIKMARSFRDLPLIHALNVINKFIFGHGVVQLFLKTLVTLFGHLIDKSSVCIVSTIVLHDPKKVN